MQSLTLRTALRARVAELWPNRAIERDAPKDQRSGDEEFVHILVANHSLFGHFGWRFILKMSLA